MIWIEKFVSNKFVELIDIYNFILWDYYTLNSRWHASM
jgi:hypothetical protein